MTLVDAAALASLPSLGNRFSTALQWAGAIIGRHRAERSFSVGSTAGDVSMPAKIRAEQDERPPGR